jgi:hypothetical protein
MQNVKLVEAERVIGEWRKASIVEEDKSNSKKTKHWQKHIRIGGQCNKRASIGNA